MLSPSSLLPGLLLLARTPLPPTRLGSDVVATSSADASDGPDPATWREFRASLISGGLKLTTDEDGDSGGDCSNAGSEAVESRRAPAARTSVAPANEALLQSQNKALFQEYLEGAWAHEAPCPEAGGLLCRLPLPAQLTRQMRAEAGGSSVWGARLRERLRSELPAEDDGGGDNDGDGGSELLEQWAANPVYTYRLAEGLVRETLQRALEKSGGGSQISWAVLDDDQKELLCALLFSTPTMD